LFSHCLYRTQDFVSLAPTQVAEGAYTAIDYVCDAESIPAADGSFDVILCTEVLEHVPEPVKVLQEIARLLCPGGLLELTRFRGHFSMLAEREIHDAPQSS
jgi:2-polyprenyl-3-methyl-5-hydroxy-6-metoxy-1,4-benzoquinol methylase